jgi:hypothetical protein
MADPFRFISLTLQPNMHMLQLLVEDDGIDTVSTVPLCKGWQM